MVESVEYLVIVITIRPHRLIIVAFVSNGQIGLFKVIRV